MFVERLFLIVVMMKKSTHPSTKPDKILLEIALEEKEKKQTKQPSAKLPSFIFHRPFGGRSCGSVRGGGAYLFSELSSFDRSCHIVLYRQCIVSPFVFTVHGPLCPFGTWIICDYFFFLKKISVKLRLTGLFGVRNCRS